MVIQFIKVYWLCNTKIQLINLTCASSDSDSSTQHWNSDWWMGVCDDIVNLADFIAVIEEIKNSLWYETTNGFNISQKILFIF